LAAPGLGIQMDLLCQRNNADHNTDEITTRQLIVRRGQPFLITVEMSFAFQPSDVLKFTVETGEAPFFLVLNVSQGSLSDLQRGIVTLSVTPAVDAPVGRYALSVETESGRAAKESLVVLFNPWCRDDMVFLPDEKERREYVMNEQGIVYKGTAHYIISDVWEFGQFEEEMVDICLRLLDVNPKYQKDPDDDVAARCNPIYVSRVISAMINSNDDRGVLTGRWDDNYQGGTCPTRWNSSVTILQQWYNNSCMAVKFGQCWVFAAVMCTVMRFFGIPCRVVTNFDSAHDENNSLTIDEYFDEYGLKDTRHRLNFHVWVEGWMKRPDLNRGSKYDGWQVLDPTPQERSEGVFCCGPAPVAAIHEGATDLKYDIPFVFSEVNADKVKWRTKMKHLSDTSSVGQNISTKAVGSFTRNDITNTYKYKEVVNIPIQIPYSVYIKYSANLDSVKVTAQASDGDGEIYEAETNLALEDPPITIKVLGEARVNCPMTIEVEFENPLNETLRSCSLTVIGCGLFRSGYIDR
uniref:Protein-glutamine gamma-glutamyltransferase 2 n=1 Tax=Fundulus heteroclitus TaxID=8078 RepID=A0A3Q2UI21_FUNHE